MDRQEQSTFSTDNFQLAAYLIAESCKLITVNKANIKRQLFIFEDNEKRNELTQRFISYQALIEPHRIFSAQRDLKQLIYQEQ